jgi:hypothetical protein
VTPALATTISLIAVISDRAVDSSPRNGVFDSVFNNASVTQVTTPPIGDLSSEERTAVEFALAAIPIGSVIDAVTLQLSPQGLNLNLGLSAGEVGEIHGYTGDGAIQVADLMVFNLVGSIVGPTANGPILVPLLTAWLQAEVNAASPYAGLMFKGADGPIPVLFNFAGASNLIPEAQRPTLHVDYHAADDITVPEPGTCALLVVGLAAATLKRHRSKWRQGCRRPERQAGQGLSAERKQ